MPQRIRQSARGVPRPVQAANGYWYATWSDGRRSKRQSLGTQDEAQALKTFAQWVLIEGWNKQGSPGAAAAAVTVADCFYVYDLKHVQTDAVMPQGKVTIAGSWKNAGPFFGPLLVPQFDQPAVDRYVEKRRKDGVAPATIRREVAQVLAALKFAATSKGGKIINKADIEDIVLPVNSPPRDRWLTMEQVQALLSAAATYRRLDGRLTRNERFLWLALFTAGREEALLELTWDRVDFQTNTIHLNVPGRRITKKRRADVIIATQLRPVLERAYAERKNNLVLDNKHSVYKALQVIAVKAGLAEKRVDRHNKMLATGFVSPHVLRHTAATHMARRGVPFWLIGQVLGDTIATVERVYAKWAPANAEGTVDLIGTLEPAE